MILEQKGYSEKQQGGHEVEDVTGKGCRAACTQPPMQLTMKKLPSFETFRSSSFCLFFLSFPLSSHSFTISRNK